MIDLSGRLVCEAINPCFAKGPPRTTADFFPVFHDLGSGYGKEEGRKAWRG